MSKIKSKSQDIEEFELVPLESRDNSSWKNFAINCQKSTPFHTLAWKRVIEDTFDYLPAYQFIERDDDIVGIVPAFKIPGIFGNEITQPFAEYGFPIFHSEIHLPSVLSHFSGTGSWFDTRIIKETSWSDSWGYSQSHYGGVNTGVTFRLHIDRSFDEMLQSVFESEIRRSIGEANDAGVNIYEADSGSRYYPLYLQTMRRLGSPPFPEGFFESLKSEYGKNCTILIAEKNNSMIGGVVVLSFNDESVIWSNASDKNAWEYKPNYLLYANAIKRTISENRSVIDFGRTSRDSGVLRFKSQFGGRKYPLVSMVNPPHRTARASIDQYRALEPLVDRLAPIITNKYIGPRLKKWIHE